MANMDRNMNGSGEIEYDINNIIRPGDRIVTAHTDTAAVNRKFVEYAEISAASILRNVGALNLSDFSNGVTEDIYNSLKNIELTAGAIKVKAENVSFAGNTERRETSLSVFKLSEFAAEIVGMFSNAFAKKFFVRLEFSAKTARAAEGDAVNTSYEDFGIVLYNLIANSFAHGFMIPKYVPVLFGGGGNQGNAEDKTISVALRAAGKYLRLSVKDNGKGFEKSILSALCAKDSAPFPNDDLGGFGIALCNTCVGNAGGLITVADIERGAEINVFAPLHREARALSDSESPASKAAKDKVLEKLRAMIDGLEHMF